MNISALLFSYHDKSGEQHNDINNFVASSLFFVINSYFLKFAPSFVLTLSCQRSHTCNFYNDLLEKLFRMMSNGASLRQIVVVQQHTKQFVDGERLHNLILTDSYKAFLDVDIIRYTADYNINEFYYIFLQIPDRIALQEMQQIFEYCWSHHIIHCSVQVQNAQGEVLIYTYFPYEPGHCGQVVPVLVNQFRGANFIKPELFPQKLRNFHKCPLRAAVWHVPPFLYIKSGNGTDRNETSWSITGGFEGRLLLELSHRLNFSLDLIVPPNNEKRGRVVGNTTNGALRMLTNRYVDLSVGCFRQTAFRNRLITSTLIYYQTVLVFAVRASLYDLNSWEILKYPFDFLTWLFILLAFALVLLTVGISNRHKKTSYLDVLLILIGMPATRLTLRSRPRPLWFKWLFSTFVVRNIYQALLFHLIRMHISHILPQSLQDLVSLNYTVITNTVTTDALLEVPGMESLPKININTTDDYIPFTYLEQQSLKRMVAVAPLDFLLHYALTHKKALIFKVLPSYVMSFPTTMYLTKHSFLIDMFNEELMWMRAMGLIDIWSRWEVDYNYFSKAFPIQDELLNLEKLKMVFILAGIGFLLSFLVFLLELLSDTCK